MAGSDSFERESEPPIRACARPIRTKVRIEGVCTAKFLTLLGFSGVCADLRLCTHPQTSGGFSTRRRRQKREAPEVGAGSSERESEPPIRACARPIRTKVRIEGVCTAKFLTLLGFSGVCADLRLCTHPQTSGGFSTRRRRQKREAPEVGAGSSERESEPPIRALRELKKFAKQGLRLY